MKPPAPVRRLSCILGLALLLAPTLWATPDHWTAEIEALTSQDAAHPPPDHGIVFVGSSSIRLWTTLAQDFPGLPVINRGFGGSELADSVYYEDRIVLPYHPRLVVLFAGTNDLWAGKSPETVATDFKAFRTRLHAALPQARLIYLCITLAPSRTRIHAQMTEANRLIAADCATDPLCTFVDTDSPLQDAAGRIRPELFQDDQLHLRPAGYAIWTKVLAPYLKP